MKIELKHYLAAYLPYNVRCEIFQDGFGWIKRDLSFDSGHDFHRKINENKVRLHLRPLSDLTKEIEVNGKKFVPSDVLSEEFLCPFYKFGQHETGWFGFIDTAFGSTKNNMPIYMDNEIMGECHYFIYQKLVEWHFDIKNLIGNNLAIDINTVK